MRRLGMLINLRSEEAVRLRVTGEDTECCSAAGAEFDVGDVTDADVVGGGLLVCDIMRRIPARDDSDLALEVTVLVAFTPVPPSFAALVRSPARVPTNTTCMHILILILLCAPTTRIYESMVLVLVVCILIDMKVQQKSIGAALF